MLAQRVLTTEATACVTAKDGFQAIDIYRKLKDQISLIILDSPCRSWMARTFSKSCSRSIPRRPVVLSSGFAEQERLRSMLARGLRGFIPKPYTQQKLLAQIRSVRRYPQVRAQWRTAGDVGKGGFSFLVLGSGSPDPEAGSSGETRNEKPALPRVPWHHTSFLNWAIWPVLIRFLSS